LRALDKVAQVVREEMNRAGALEISMPMVQPADLWRETGRWDIYGRELLRLKDRHDRDYCLGPTHEEVITDLVRGEIRSYRQLPVNLYQVQTKFRDEIRPRFGLMRGREFVMKDAYSFDKDEQGASESYQKMYDAYARCFSRMGMRFRAVEADSGAIGGSFSHEFMVLADTGEDVIAVCNSCDYAANLEKAVVRCEMEDPGSSCPSVDDLATPGKRTVEDVAAYLNVGAESILKTLLFDADGEIVAALVRGDRELNEVKLKNLLGASVMEMASPEQVQAVSGAPVGFAGPMGLKVERIYADCELSHGDGWIAGGNAADMHVKNLSLARDVSVNAFADLRTITANDPCPKCDGHIELTRGIEVGHVFKLGCKYSEAMNAVFLDESGKEQLMVMGCYGIGVSRIVAACIEQNHDEAGIVFPPPVAPYEVALLHLSPKDAEITAQVLELYTGLQQAGLDVLMDDRDERPGVKFKDADLIGAPLQLIAGAKALSRGVVEAKDRRTGEREELPLENFLEAFMAWRERVRHGWGLTQG